jgi:hypothetical protein
MAETKGSESRCQILAFASARDNRLDVVSQVSPPEYLEFHGIFLMESWLTRVSASILAQLAIAGCLHRVYATRDGLKGKGSIL